jgi:outer membrane autotransporter protein
VTGAGSTWTTGRIDIGFGITGTLTVADGGKVTSTDSDIGFAATGTATVTGAGSTWTSDYLAVGLYGNDGNGTLTVAEGGKVLAPTVLIGLNYGSAGTINVGAAAGEDAVAAGTLDATTIKFANGNGALVFNHTGTLTFAAALTSTGYDTHALDHYAGTTTLTGDSSGFKGTTTVEGGTLLVGDSSGNGKLGGTVHVEAGGTLGGSGTILGATTVDGTLSAGNSPGTLTFASDLKLNPDSTSVFELNSPGVVGGTGNDLVAVAGDLTLAGTLDARVAAAGYYRLFNYDGTLSGTFSGGTLTGTGGFTPASPDDPDIQYGIPGQVNLSVLATGQTMQFWDGGDMTGNGVVDGGTGAWSTAGTNWTGKPGEAAINGTWGGSVGVFAGAAGGTVTVTDTQSFDTLQFSTDGYVLQGSALALGAAAGGTFNVDNDVSTTVASAIGDGAGLALRKTGAGTLVLVGTNTYTGGTLVQAGTLIGDTDSIRGDLANAGSVVFDQAGNASFTGDIIGYGGTDGTVTKRGAGALMLGCTSSLDWSIEAGGLVSASDRFGGNAAIGSGASFAFDQTTSGTYAGLLSGTGSFVKTGSGTVVLTGDSSAFGGTTSVSGGTLNVGQSGSGALGGTINVLSGASLGGTGNLGSAGSLVTIAAGGVHAPGASQSILGDYANHGTLQIEASPTAANEMVVAGGVDITGATLDLVLSPANAESWNVFNGPFTIIEKQSAATVTGTFGSVTQNLLFLYAQLAYDGGDGNDVTLEMIRNDLAFAGVGQTRNQRATGAAVDALGNGNVLWRSIALTSDPDIARKSFDALSGEIHASARTALIDDSRFVRDAINDRIRAAFDGVGSAVVPVLAYGETGTGDGATAAIGHALAPADTASLAAWGSAFGSWGSTDGDGNAAGLDHSVGGFFTGIDGLVTDDVRLGIMTGYSHSSFDVDGRGSSGESDNYHLGIYGGGQWRALGMRAGAAYTWHNVSTARSVAIPGFADNLTADYNAGTFQAFGEAGYRIDTAAVSFEPFANLAYVNLHTDSFTEKGGAAALHADGQTTDTTFTTLGVRASTDFVLCGTNVKARGMIGWRHAFGDTTPLATLAFAGSNTFAIAGVPIPRDSAVVEAGLDLNLSPSATLGLSCTGQLASGAQVHGFKANLAIKF